MNAPPDLRRADAQPNCASLGKAAVAGARDHQFRVAGDWALATDDIQWIIQHRRQRAGKVAWRPVSFVRSTKSVLGRCLLEKGAGTSATTTLLADLPETFDQWVAVCRNPQAGDGTASPVRRNGKAAA